MSIALQAQYIRFLYQYDTFEMYGKIQDDNKDNNKYYNVVYSHIGRICMCARVIITGDRYLSLSTHSELTILISGLT